MEAVDTIAAIATGLGEAGVGVIRVSGPGAVGVADLAFRPRRGAPLHGRPSHQLVYGRFMRGEEAVDEGLAVVMRAPNSYTGEDVVEFHSHGGQVALKRVLSATLAAGARLAEPGEFTRRAFLNGRMDLSQAEAVIDIIRAKTDRAMAAAVRLMSGGLGNQISAIRNRLLEITAHLEADIDFPELNLEVKTSAEVTDGCQWCLQEIEALLAGARQGRLLREGLRVVIAGRPNVGKSSLLNRLVRENRAIVTEVPGTTRDVIEEWVSIGGFPVVLADTAGIRETSDVVERLGVDRSREMLAQADLVLLVVDSAVGVTPEDRKLLDLIPGGTAKLAVANKVDLVPGDLAAKIGSELGDLAVIGVSATEGTGIEEVEAAIGRVAGVSDKDESLVANARQEEALRTAASHLEAALATQESGLGADLVSIDVRSAWAMLGEITGETVGEDLLDQIFSRFCIGK